MCGRPTSPFVSRTSPFPGRNAHSHNTILQRIINHRRLESFESAIFQTTCILSASKKPYNEATELPHHHYAIIPGQVHIMSTGNGIHIFPRNIQLHLN
ncbi:hypothetical protein P280DRAFT_78004 [Massarina eburnea CBS 473.64]|uniref:Uncharacterized protein n=1 Tax=Massarina eburnea CBS 473.64 TaxID=1395130 RepID=A0A6A6RRU9_9PLEO|nr:hypothetical protein P280DRAFT_78004 [Massarina eburnea CBS 473.64]